MDHTTCIESLIKYRILHFGKLLLWKNPLVTAIIIRFNNFNIIKIRISIVSTESMTDLNLRSPDLKEHLCLISQILPE